MNTLSNPRSEIRTENKKSILWYCIMSFIVFCFTFDFSVRGLRSVQLSIVAILLWTIVRNYKKKSRRIESNMKNRYLNFIRIHIILFIYVLFLYFIIGVGSGPTRPMFFVLILFFIYRLLPTFAFYQCIDSFDELMRIILISTLLQTVIIWMCLLSPSFQAFIDTFNLEEQVEQRIGYAGGLGCITSQGVIRYSIGMVACIYYYFKEKSIWSILVYSILAVTCTMISRTGLVISVVGVVFLTFSFIRTISVKQTMVISTSVIILLVALNLILGSNAMSSFFNDRFFRLTALFEEVEYANELSDIYYFDAIRHGEDARIPPVTVKTLVGVGITAGIAGNGVHINADGEFIRVYAAYGLIIAIFFYLYFYTMILRTSFSVKDRSIKLAMLFMLCVIIVSQFKEFTIYAACHVPIFFLMAFYAYRENSQQLEFSKLMYKFKENKKYEEEVLS